MRRMRRTTREQLEIERTVRYEDIEQALPPSLRRDYKPVNYYNAPTLLEMEERAEGAKRNADSPEKGKE